MGNFDQLIDEKDAESLINKSKNDSALILINNKNFIHNRNHSENVEKNILNIYRSELKPKDLFVLKLASHWHDTGRNDNNTELSPHEIKSVELFKTWAKDNSIHDSISKEVVGVILSHRSNGLDESDFVSSVFWESDKLDILNVERCSEIVNLYRKGKSSLMFNIYSTKVFWNSIDDNFIDNFKLSISKEVVKNRYKEFKEFRREFNNNIDKSCKIIGVGGLAPGSEIFKELDISIIGATPGNVKKICYIPIAVFNNKELLKGTDEYVASIKSYYESISDGVEFDSVKVSDDTTAIIKKIRNSDIIYISGGDTEYLIGRLSALMIKRELELFFKSGKVIIGNSAGILSLLADTVSINEDNEINKYRGIGLIDNCIIIVHFKETYNSILNKLKDSYPDKVVIPLEEEGVFMYVDGSMGVL